MNAKEVYADELEYYDDFTEDIVFTERDTRKMRKEGNQKNIIGYYAYYRLDDGFEKTVYRTVEELDNHGKQYSSNYKKTGTGLWKDNFKAMALKTVIKELLTKWGMMSVEMQQAINYDYGTTKFGQEENVEYLDNKPIVVESQDVTEMATDIFGDENDGTEETK